MWKHDFLGKSRLLLSSKNLSHETLQTCISRPYAWRMIANIYLGGIEMKFPKRFFQDHGGQGNVKLRLPLSLAKY